MSTGSRWIATTESLDNGGIQRLTIRVGVKTLSCREVCDLWRREAGFAIFFSATLAAMPFDAFLWEVRPITMASVDERFECVIVDSPALSGVTADSDPFGTQLDAAHSMDDIATFGNLGGDALLIAPCAGSLTYAHLAVFVRQAPEQTQYNFWSRVGSALVSQLGSAPVWLSTSGLGVHWLHVRLDRYPKYYTYMPYRQINGN